MSHNHNHNHYHTAQIFILRHFLARRLTNASPLIALATHLCVIIASTVKHMTLSELLHGLLMEKRSEFFLKSGQRRRGGGAVVILSRHSVRPPQMTPGVLAPAAGCNYHSTGVKDSV